MAQILMQQAASMAPTPSRGAAIARALQGGLAGVYENWDRRDKTAADQSAAEPPARAPAAPGSNASVALRPVNAARDTDEDEGATDAMAYSDDEPPGMPGAPSRYQRMLGEAVRDYREPDQRDALPASDMAPQELAAALRAYPDFGDLAGAREATPDPAIASSILGNDTLRPSFMNGVWMSGWVPADQHNFKPRTPGQAQAEEGGLPALLIQRAGRIR